MKEIKFERKNRTLDVVIVITGETYPHRELLKKMGFQFSRYEYDIYSHWHSRQLNMKTSAFIDVMKSTKALADADADVVISLIDA